MGCLIVFLMLINSSPVFAAEEFINNAQQVTKTPSSIEQVIYQEVEAENNHNWSAVSSYWVEDEQDLMLPFIANKENKDNFIGLFNIKSAKIAEIKEVPIDSIKPFVGVEKYLEKYSDIKVYYVGIDYTVHNESMFYYNGVNYRLAVVVPENGQWKLAEMSDAPVADLVASNISFGSSGEKISQKIHQARNKGLFINPSGKVIKNIAATEAEKAEERGNKVLFKDPSIEASATNDHVIPSSINIYLTKSTNYKYYGYTVPTTRSIGFYDYIKNVLPNEWISSWPAESLKAGAMCVKMFGWYHVYNPKFPQYNAALTDSSSDSQNFLVNTAVPNTTNAINAIGGIAIETRSSLALFETGYRDGSYDDSWYHYGLVSQYGTKYLAENEGYDYYGMLHYYYDLSWATGNELIIMFYY